MRPRMKTKAKAVYTYTIGQDNIDGALLPLAHLPREGVPLVNCLSLGKVVEKVSLSIPKQFLSRLSYCTLFLTS